MSQSELSTDSDREVIVRIAMVLDASELVDVATAVCECCASPALRQYDEPTVALAAFTVASRRALGTTPDLSAARERVDADPVAVDHAVELVETALSPPAPTWERRRLRQSIVAIDELLAAIEAGRSNPPRLAGPGFEAADPRVLAAATRPLDQVDLDALRRDRRRFDADLALARLGVELFVQVHAEQAVDR